MGIQSANLSDMKSGRQLLAEYQRRTERNQRQLAHYLKLAEPTMSHFLTGYRRPGLVVAMRIEELTGVPARSWLLKRSGKKVSGNGAGARNRQTLQVVKSGPE
jgi:plasmid maintenance system antidote protein VapI